VKVKSGQTNPATGQPYQPWDIVPYGLWQLDLPISHPTALILGAAYDAVTKRLFVSIKNADVVGYDPFPVIHVYEVQL
jgi:hypothetical protein